MARKTSNRRQPSLALAELRGAVSLGALMLLVLGVLAFADRSVPPLDAVRSLWIHLGAALMLAGALLLGLRARRGLLAIIAGAAFVALPMKVVFWDAQSLAAPTGPSLRVLTINALVSNPNDAAVAAAIIDGDYDVVVVQEAPMLWDRLAELDAVYPHRVGCETPQTCDLVLLSRHRLETVRWTPFDTRAHRLVTAVAQVDGRSVGIAAVHLTKPHHDGTQRYETFRLIRTLGGLPANAVLMGDFNAAPWTGLLGWLRGATGFRTIAGYRPTAPARIGPLGVPIDHVMLRGGLGVSRIAVLGDALGSNHFGVEADLFLGDDGAR